MTDVLQFLRMLDRKCVGIDEKCVKIHKNTHWNSWEFSNFGSVLSRRNIKLEGLQENTANEKCLLEVFLIFPLKFELCKRESAWEALQSSAKHGRVCFNPSAKRNLKILLLIESIAVFLVWHFKKKEKKKVYLEKHREEEEGAHMRKWK